MSQRGRFSSEKVALVYLHPFWTPPRRPPLRRDLRRTRTYPARRKGCRTGAVRWDLSRVIGPVLRRGSLYEPLAGGDRRRSAWNRPTSVGKSQTANPGGLYGH